MRGDCGVSTVVLSNLHDVDALWFGLAIHVANSASDERIHDVMNLAYIGGIDTCHACGLLVQKDKYLRFLKSSINWLFSD